MPLLRHKLDNWVIPTLYALTSVVAGVILPRIEVRVLPNLDLGLTPQSALAIYSSVGSGMLALTGIVFSLVFVMVQFSAIAYSPRLVLWVARDPVIWHSLGIFTATFLYSIAAIAWVDRTPGKRVPLLSGWLVVALLLASVVMFIALIDRISLLQINGMLTFTGNHGRRVIESLYPPFDTDIATPQPDEFLALPVTQILLHRGQPRAIQALDESALLKASVAAGGIVEVVSSVGDIVVEGTELLRVRGGRRKIEESVWRGAFELGSERTFKQDPKYAIRLLVDIAIRALSPAVNDPTTAVQALDQIEDLLLRLGRRRLEVGAVRDSSNTLRIVITYPTWEDFLALAFDEIRYCGAKSVQVMRRMRALIAQLALALPQERRKPLQHHLVRLDVSIARTFDDEEEKQEALVEDRQGLGVPRRNSASC